MPHNALNYTKCAVIVHGKSEFVLVKYIYTNLHLPVKIIAKDKGRGSIQINGLSEYLRKKQFRTLKEFANEYSVEYDRKTKGLKNFKLNSHPSFPFCKRVSHFESDLQILYPTFHFCNDFPVFFLAFMI